MPTLIRSNVNTCKLSIIQSLEGLDTRVKGKLMWNVELKDFDYFLCVSAYDLGVFGPYFPQIVLMFESL